MIILPTIYLKCMPMRVLLLATAVSVSLATTSAVAQSSSAPPAAIDYSNPSSVPSTGMPGVQGAGFQGVGIQGGGFQNGGFQTGGFGQGFNQATSLQTGNYLIGGGYRYGINGTFLNAYGQQVYLNPLVPFVWPANRPQFTGGAAFTCRIGNFNCNFWRGNSGYYYPFMTNTFQYAPIIFVDTNGSTPQAKLPPPAIQLTDSLKYLDDSLKDKKVVETHYKHLKQRAIDLQRKERSMRIAQGGELDAEGEAEIRRDLDGLAKEMSEHVKDR